MPTFTQYVAFSFLTHRLYVTDRTFRKYTTLLCDPDSAFRAGTQLLFVLGPLNHSWGFWFGCGCNIMSLLVDPNPLDSTTVCFLP